MGMTLADTVKSDLTTAMKAGERDRVGALRLILSELQKAAKDGIDDELAVLRRERKRRVESATAFRAGGRRRARRPRGVRGADHRGLPARRAVRRELQSIVAGGDRRDRRDDRPKDMGAVMKAAMPKVAGRADGKRVSAIATQTLRS